MKKMVCMFLSLVMLATLFAGCSKNEKAPADAGTSEDVANATGEFSWDRFSGEKINIMFVEHTLTTDMINEIEGFEELTGIDVEYTVIPEANYFDKVSALLSSQSNTLDIFMTGPYQMWQYASANYMADFDTFLNNESLVDPEYNVEDFYQNILDSCRWDCEPGNPTGSGPLWGIPLNFEANVLVYNKRLLEENNLEVPTTTDELLETATALQNHSGEGTYGFACRGSLSWATLITAYESFYATFGGTDFTAADDGTFAATVNEAAGVEATDWFVKLVQQAGSDTWASTTYAEAVGDVGAGTAAMCVDASGSCLSVCLEDASEEWENLAIAPLPVVEEGQEPLTNLYSWSLAINSASEAQGAAWYFIQYVTMPDTLHDMLVAESDSNTTRESTFEAEDYQAILNGVDGYIETFEATVDNCKMYYTPNSYAFEVLETWCQTIQELVEGKYDSTQAGMDELATKLEDIVNR